MVCNGSRLNIWLLDFWQSAQPPVHTLMGGSNFWVMKYTGRPRVGSHKMLRPRHI